MIAHVKKFWTLYGAAIVSTFTYLSPYIATEIAKHPRGTEALAAAAFILGKLTKSPVQAK